MTRPPSRPPARPRVRPVKVRLSGDDADVRVLAELLAEHLPVVTADRVQVGDLSAAYPNRRGGGCRRYVEVYVLDDGVHLRAEPADAAGDPPALPAARARPIAGR